MSKEDHSGDHYDEEVNILAVIKIPSLTRGCGYCWECPYKRGSADAGFKCLIFNVTLSQEPLISMEYMRCGECLASEEVYLDLKDHLS